MTRRDDSDAVRRGHPISVVARRTGLSQDLLRAWERRYHAVTPRRTGTGRRLYTDRDIEKLRLLKLLVDGGRRISDVAELDAPALAALAAEDRLESRLPPRRAVTAAAPDGASFLAHCVAAIDDLDEDALTSALGQASVALSAPRLRADVLAPLLELLGERWQDGSWRVAHEHFASAVLRSVLWDTHRRTAAGAQAPVIVAATPSGHRHELGLLLAITVAAEQGWRVVYLGPDTPCEEIAAIVQARGARGVILSLVYPGADARTGGELRRLRQLLGPDVAILVGGRLTTTYREALQDAAAIVIADLDQLQNTLQRLFA